MQALETSIANDGWIGAITVAADGETFDGSARVEKTAENGMLDDPIVLDIDGTRPVVLRRTDIPNATDPRAVRLGVAANRVASLNLEWEPDVLASIADSGVDLGALFTDVEWAEVSMPALPEAGGGGDEFDTTPEDGPTRTSLGELWSIGGKHRLLVGDCTDAANVARLMGGERADMVLTDPPYGIKRDKGFEGFEGFGGFGPPIARRQYADDWDSERPAKDTLDLLLSVAPIAIIWGGNFFADLLPLGRHWLVWDKHNTMPTFGDCELAWTNIDRTSVKKYDVTYNGLIGKEVERYHPTQKPVRLFEMVLSDYTEGGALVVDLYLGSGTTLIAAHRTGRRCFGMEIAPRYADVILRRAEAEGLECALLDGR